VWVLADDIYEHILYDGLAFATPVAVEPRLRERTLTVNGVSKAYAMTGWRVGYGAGPRALIAAMAVVQSQTTSCPSSISQAAAIEALTGPQDIVAERCADFQARRDFVVAALNRAPGLRCRVPEGAFYTFASCAGVLGKRTRGGTLLQSDSDFCGYLLQDFEVAVVPGSVFGLAPYFRISYATSMSQLEDGVRAHHRRVQRPRMTLTFSLPLRGRAGVGARGMSIAAGVASAACPHPGLPPARGRSNTHTFQPIGKSMTSPRTGGQILVDQLITHGVKQLFCVPGESFLAVLDALHDAAIDVTVCRQEGGATMMAEAQGKLTGQPGVCFVTRGPGATNAAAGVHIAHQDSTPLLLFVGQVARDALGREAFQELDYGAVFGTMAKWVVQIDDPARVPELVSRAFHVATSGRPGPVVIALPEDMLTEAATVADALPYAVTETHPGAAQIAELQQRLSQAQRPVVILGGSRWSEKAALQFADFAAAYSLPVYCSFRRQMLLSAEHPSYAGDLGLGANPRMLERIRNADLVLLVGGRLSEVPSQGYELLAIPQPKQSLVHVHADADELGKLYRPAQGIHATPQASPRPWPRCAPRHARVAGGGEDRARRLPALERPGAHPHPGPAADGRGHAAPARGAAGRHHLLQRRGQLRHLGAPLLAVPRVRQPAGAHQRLDGLRPAGRRGAPSACGRSARWSCSPATATS
jgi:hypothetical protein